MRRQIQSSRRAVRALGVEEKERLAAAPIPKHALRPPRVAMMKVQLSLLDSRCASPVISAQPGATEVEWLLTEASAIDLPAL